MGRPIVGDEPKDIQIKFRISKTDNEKLEKISKMTRMNKSEVLRNGIGIQYNQLRNKNRQIKNTVVKVQS